MNANRKLIIRYAKANKTGSDKTVSIPLAAYKVAEKLLPKQLRELIAENNIDMSVLSGTEIENLRPAILIEIESAGGRLVLSVE